MHTIPMFIDVIFMCVKSNVCVLQYKHMQGFVSTKIHD